MRLSLPAISTIPYDETTAREVHYQLTSVIAGHAQAVTTYRFYEEIDRWLGPWGERGYPIGYGKFYNIAFTTNEKLMNNPETYQWVWRTTIFLQEALRDYLVRRIRNHTLRKITEFELRQAAFDSHTIAYEKGGLSMVAIMAPELLPLIAIIPAAEFSPTSRDFSASVKQLLMSVVITTTGVVRNVFPSVAGPAHTGVYRIAMGRIQQKRMSLMALSQELSDMEKIIRRGHADYIPVLDCVIRELNSRQFPDEGYARFARAVVRAAQFRRFILQIKYADMLQQAPEVREKMNHFHKLAPQYFRCK